MQKINSQTYGNVIFARNIKNILKKIVHNTLN